MARKDDFIKIYDKLNEELCLPFQALECSGRGMVSTSFDYIFAAAKLAEYLKIAHFFPTKPKTCKELVERLDKPTQLRLRGHSMMLASQYDGLKPEEQKRLFDSKDYVFTEKMNGVRLWLICIGGVIKVFSRNYAVDCTIPEYSANIFFGEVDTTTDFAMDCELVISKNNGVREKLAEIGLETSSPLEVTSALLQMEASNSIKFQREHFEATGEKLLTFYVITPLLVRETELFNMPFGKLKPRTDQMVKSLQDKGFPILNIRQTAGTRAEKEAFLSQIVDIEHGEGVVVHNNASVYLMSENRSKQGFIKIKRSVGAMADKLGMGDTIDGWVSGFDLGSDDTSNEALVSSLHISIIIKEGETEREYVSNKKAS